MGHVEPEAIFLSTEDQLLNVSSLWPAASQDLDRSSKPCRPDSSDILSVGGDVIRADLLHLMCRSHMQSDTPQLNDMLANLTNTHPGHPQATRCCLSLVQFASCHQDSNS